MSIPYATYSEFTMVYCFKGVSPDAINSWWLIDGSNRVNEAFSSKYTTPFSSNNWTAKSLTIHYAALGILVRTLKTDDSEELKDDIESRIKSMLKGDSFMIDSDGNVLQPDKTAEDKAWGSTMEYKPTFDMRPDVDQRVDPDRLQDEYDEDY